MAKVHFNKSSKFIEDTIANKYANRTRLDEQEVDFLLTKMGGSQAHKLSAKIFAEDPDAVFYSDVETAAVEMYTQSHVDFLRNVRDIFFYFDLTYTGRITRVG